MIFQIFNLIFGITAFVLSLRHEVELFNYIFSLNYSILSLFAIEVIKTSVYSLGEWDKTIDFTSYLIITLLILVLHNNLTLLSFNKVALIFTYRLLIITLIITVVVIQNLDIFIIAVVLLNSIIILVLRIIHFDEFRYGTIHPRYAYINFLLYSLVGAELLVEQYFEKDIHGYYLCLPLAFVYDFQLNLFYSAIRLGYSTFFRSGTFSRFLLVIDYYEIPDTKV